MTADPSGASGLRHWSAAACWLGFGIAFSNPSGDMDACLSLESVVYVWSGTGVCVELITRPGYSYQVSVCDLEASILRTPWPHYGLLCHGNKERSRLEADHSPRLALRLRMHGNVPPLPHLPA